MKVQGSTVLHATPDAVYAALNDPAVLQRTIPGVTALERLDDDRYRMTVTAGVASIKGSYDGEVSLGDHDPPRSFTLRANGSGAPGTVDATVRVRLEASDGATRLDYDADAAVGGMVGGVGQRMLAGAANRTAKEFFGNVDAVLTGAAPAPAAAEGPATAGARPPALAGPRRTVEDDMRVPFWVVLAGVGAGAFWALAGVVVGWAVTRDRRRR